MKQHEKKAKWKIRCDLLKCSYFFDFCSIGVKLQWETLSCLCGGGIPQISPILLVLECCSCTSNGCITRACQCQFIALLYSYISPFSSTTTSNVTSLLKHEIAENWEEKGKCLCILAVVGCYSPPKNLICNWAWKAKGKEIAILLLSCVCSHRTSTETALL